MLCVSAYALCARAASCCARVMLQGEVEEARRAKFAVEAELAETRDAFEKLEQTAAKLRVTQEGASRELIDHQVQSIKKVE